MEGRRYSSWLLERVHIGETYRLRFGISTMGRHSSSNIRILDATFISRHHATLEISDNDENVTIKDVSSNGIFVNETKYDKATVELKNNDFIGIGVSPTDDPDDIDFTRLPIFQLKYAPIRKFHIPNFRHSTPASSSKPGSDIKKKIESDGDRGEQEPCCSKNMDVKNSTTVEEIFEISDDEEYDVAAKPKIKENDMIKQGKQNNTEMRPNEDHQKSVLDLNKNNVIVIKNEPFTDTDFINPSQKRQEQRLDDVIVVKCESNPSQKQPNDKAVNSEIEENHNKSTVSGNPFDHIEPVIHVPIMSNIKKERIRSVSADIQNIFGDIADDDVMQQAIKNINPLVYNEIHVSKNLKSQDDKLITLNSGDLINLTDDEDLEEVEIEELGTIITNITENKKASTTMGDTDKEPEANKLVSVLPDTTASTGKDSEAIGGLKSPNLFDFSLDKSKEKLSIEEGNPNDRVNTTTDNVNLDEYTKHISNSDDEDIEDILFSQIIIDDMKAELQEELHVQEKLPLSNKNIDKHIESSFENIGNTVNIKQEPGLDLFSAVPKELENSCWIISDDEDYDEELETKVNDWSNKIFSQSFSLLSQSMSQVYEIEEPDKSDENGENDCYEEDNLSLLEDDIDGIADIYNSTEKAGIDKEVESLNNETTNEKLNHKPAKEEILQKSSNVKDVNIREEKLESDNDEQVMNEETSSNQKNQSPVKEKSPIIQSNVVIRLQKIDKNYTVTGSPSSLEDETDIKNNKVPNDTMHLELDKSITKIPPPVIQAPALPKHIGKLRGVSAELPKKTILNTKTTSVNKTFKSIKEKLHHERNTKDLKRKWLEKPSIAKKREKEHKKYIKEIRKDKLKELAERKKSPSKENIKRKLPPREDSEHKAKIAKVKVTTHNRGAFLANDDPLPSANANTHKNEQANQFKIPKMSKKLDEPKKPNSAETKEKNAIIRSLSVDDYETFSQQISKPDVLLLNRQKSDAKKCDKVNEVNKIHNPAPLRRHSITETLKRPMQSNLDRSAICKEALAARAVRTTNKITFASMEKNIVESEENKRKLSELNAKNTTPSNTINTSSTKLTTKKKTVRFNDTPVIHYIERVTGACKKIINKDVMPMTTYKDRRHFIRSMYPIIDHTNAIISKILCWSNEWLIKRNAAAEAAGDVIYPMPTHFSSFEHYKSIIFPLMKLEFVSTLEREYNSSQNVKSFKVSLDYATPNEDRIILITKFSIKKNKDFTDSSLYDLVILEPDKRGPQIFAFVVANRKGVGTFVTIVYEIIAKNFTIEYFKTIKEFNVRPVMDKVRIHFGAFNSIYQLQSTPLFQKVINPYELLKCRPPPKKKVIYRGFDKLNDKQRQVLLNTYVKIIDESTPNMTLIQGPPGTGKSCVIANLVLQTLYGEEVRYLDKKILICAQSNAAVDVIAFKLYDISMRMRPEKRFRILRYGMLNKMHPKVLPIALQKVVENDQLKKLQAKNKNICLENKENLKNQILQFEALVADMSSRNIKGTVEEDVLIEKKRQLQLMRNILNENMRPEDERSLYSWYLCNANIVCATLSSCVNLSQYINFFDICIIDEATQCSEPWTLLPLKFGINSLVLVGDTQQLPATILSKKAHELGLGTSLFTRIQQCLDSVPCTSVNGSTAATTTPNNIIYCLQTQYRMHPEICRWPNQYFYRNELINAKSTIEFNKTPLVPFCILSLIYTQNSAGIDGKITNNLEAEFVAKLLKALDGYIPNKYNSYGVITPYAHHRATLESSIRNLGLTNIMVNTIDSYQGLEKDVIVISNARTNGIGFLSNPQRLNVALTRSKKCLILCGNFRNLETVPSWRCLLENARERKLYHDIGANCIEDIQTNVIEKIKLKNQNQ